MGEWWGTFKSALSSFETAGTLGAILSMRWVPGNSWTERFFSFVSGLGMAFFIGPYLMEHINVQSENGLMASGFLLGVFGAHIISKGFTFVRSKKFDLQKLIDLLQVFKGH